MIYGLINDISMAFAMAFAMSRSLFACLEAPGTAGPCSSFLSPAGPGRVAEVHKAMETAHSWHIYGTFMENLWKIYGKSTFMAHSWHIYGKSMGKNRGIPVLFTNPFANDSAKLLSGAAFCYWAELRFRFCQTDSSPTPMPLISSSETRNLCIWLNFVEFHWSPWFQWILQKIAQMGYLFEAGASWYYSRFRQQLIV